MITEKQKHVEDLVTTAEKAELEWNMRQLYDTTRKLVGKYSKLERPVKYKEGKIMNEIREQLTRWVRHFEELLDRPAPLNSSDIEAALTDLPIGVTLPTVEGMGVDIRLLKVDKAAGPENIPTRRLKLDMKVIVKMRHISCRQIWEGDQVPSDWREGHFIKIPKKRDLSKCENYKDITLLPVARKVFNSVAEPDESFSRRPTLRSTGWIR
ncbi:unnamed protein product [Schistosoma curassoni]|uniref:Reverse transcriptase domain-containing protein n=1 Tax=Schistosoma curassoni TaxID=6186 RepID=A0A183KCF8_9TREM|nr:unnamed protein product [Schistosoma curassoni]